MTVLAARSGETHLSVDYIDADKRGAELAARVPDLLMQAKRIATTVVHGLHGRRRAGPGETFWQFRRFQSGEPARRIDWRRSGRDDHLYVREREWEAAHTVWIALDRSASMYFRSDLAEAAKIDRAVTLTLALAHLLVRSGERVGVVGLMRPTASRWAAERAAEALVREPDPQPMTFPKAAEFARFSDLVVISDLLDPIIDIEPMLSAIANRGVAGFAAQIIDPVEQVFPYAGRVEFTDPETGERLIMGRADHVRDAFRSRMRERHDRLLAMFRRMDWSLLVHHTDRPAELAMMALHAQLSGHGVPMSAREMPRAGEQAEAAT